MMLPVINIIFCSKFVQMPKQATAQLLFNLYCVAARFVTHVDYKPDDV